MQIKVLGESKATLDNHKTFSYQNLKFLYVLHYFIVKKLPSDGKRNLSHIGFKFVPTNVLSKKCN